jgi:hypothetical protein
MTGRAARVAARAKRVEFRFGRHLHESPERSIREIQTHEVCPGRETAPGFFHVRVDHCLRALEAKDFEQRLNMLASEPPKDRGRPDDAS